MVHQESLEPSSDGTALLPAPISGGRLWTDSVTFSQLRSLDAGSWYGADFTGCSIPSLTEVAKLGWGKAKMLLDLKDPCWWKDEDSSEWIERLLPAVKQSIAGSEAEESLHLLSFSPAMLAACGRYFRDVSRVLNVWPLNFVNLKWIMRAAEESGSSVVQLADSLVLEHPSWVEELRIAGLKVFAFETTPAGISRHGQLWTAESRRGVWQELINAQVDGITCDFPKVLMDMLDGLNSGSR